MDADEVPCTLLKPVDAGGMPTNGWPIDVSVDGMGIPALATTEARAAPTTTLLVSAAWYASSRADNVAGARAGAAEPKAPD